MITNRDIEIAIIKAQQEVDTRLKDSQQELFEPDFEMTAESLFASMPNGAKEMLRKQNPELYNRMNRR